MSIEDIISRLEQATEGSRELDALIWLAIGRITPEAQKSWNAPIPLMEYAERSAEGYFRTHFTRELSAAETLIPKHDRGGWFWRVGHGAENAGWAHLNKHHLSNCDRGDEVHAIAATPALALCIASLKARVAK